MSLVYLSCQFLSCQTISATTTSTCFGLLWNISPWADVFEHFIPCQSVALFGKVMEILGDEVGHWRWIMTSGVMREDMGTTGSRAVWVSYPQSSGIMIPWEILDVWQEAPGFGIFAAVVLTCFSKPDFPCCVPRPQFWSGQAYSVTLYVRSLCTLLFRSAHGSDIVLSLRWDVDFGLLNNVETVKEHGYFQSCIECILH